MYWRNKRDKVVEAYQIVGWGEIDHQYHLLLRGRVPMPISESVIEALEIEPLQFVSMVYEDHAAEETFHPMFDVWEPLEFLNEHQFAGAEYSRAIH